MFAAKQNNKYLIYLISETKSEENSEKTKTINMPTNNLSWTCFKNTSKFKEGQGILI